MIGQYTVAAQIKIGTMERVKVAEVRSRQCDESRFVSQSREDKSAV